MSGIASIRLFETPKASTQRLSVGFNRRDSRDNDFLVDLVKGLGEETKITHVKDGREASALLQQPGVYFDYLELDLDVVKPIEVTYLEILARARNEIRDLKDDPDKEKNKELRALLITPEGEQAALEFLVKQRMRMSTESPT